MAAPVSAAFFNPQSRAPTPDYLSHLHAFLSRHAHGKALLRHVADLESVWPVWAAAREEVRTLPNALRSVRLLVDWANGGSSTPVSAARTGLIALPLLLILQLGQYFRYLEHHSLSHADFIAQTRRGGGIQGCCGGEPPALSVACAVDEAHVVENAAVFLRIVLGVGAYIEAVDDWTCSEPTILALRLKHENQRDEIIQRFPRTYVSAITEPKSLSFVGSAASIAALFDYARSEGLPADKMDVTGKAHNPENSHLVPEFLDILKRNQSLLQLPDNSRLQVPVRSNRTGDRLTDASVMEDMVIMMLAACCDWYRLVTRVAEDMKASESTPHHVVIFGMNDSVPLSPFNMQRLRISKFKAHTLLSETPEPTHPDCLPVEPLTFPENSIAVVGVACRLPGADNLEELWELISNGSDTHQELPEDRIDRSGSFRASQDPSLEKRKFFGNFVNDIKRFDNSFFGINAKEAAALDPQQRMLLELSYEALESSGYTASSVRHAGDAVGCFIGNSMNEYLENTTSHGPSAYTATGTIRAFLCGRLSHYYGWCAPSEVIDTACSSSLVAINRACRAIQMGDCDMAVAGGASAITHLNNFIDLGKAGFLSPTGQCKPFDASADGYCRAEGAGLVVLKKLSVATSAGDQIFGVIPAIATNQGGTSASLTVPSSTALSSLYRKVLGQAGAQPWQISYVEAHGTGTQAGDPIEMDSIRSVFGSASRPIPVSIGSIKGNIGHCESAAGVAGLLKVLAMLKYGKIPPQVGHLTLNPKIRDITPDRMEITRSLKSWDASQRAALVNSYGAGGSNCALLCVEMGRPQQRSVPSSQRARTISYPLILSAASRSSLLASAQALSVHLSKNPTGVSIDDVAFTLSQCRKRYRHCFSTHATSTSDLARTLASGGCRSFEHPNDSKPVVMALSGQYDNKVALDKGIYEAYPLFRSYIEACDDELFALGHESIRTTIFQTEPISTAVMLQSSIFAVQYACAKCWIDSGLRPAVVIGHSLGEIVGLAVSGVLSLKDALSLVVFRANLIDTQWENDRGEMLAIHSDISNIEKLISQLKSSHHDRKLDVACYNASNCIVVAGSSTMIRLAVQTLSTNLEYLGTKYQQLSTSHAFHSSLVNPILPRLERMSRGLTWNHPVIPMETCSIHSLPSMQEWNASRHARDPVHFVDAVKRIEQRLGSCIWFEAGLSSPIISMARRACSDQTAHVYQSIAPKSSERPWDCISTAVSECWQYGISLSHWAFLDSKRGHCKQIWLPPYQFEQHRHWMENVDRAMKAHQQLVGHRKDPEPTPREAKSQLVIRKDSLPPRPQFAEFFINTHCERFRKLVAGHAVLRNPLCPAPLYMECASMALYELSGTLDTKSLTFEDLHFRAPLGLDPSRTVELHLEESAVQSWKFTVRSTPAEFSSDSLVHCTGTVLLAGSSSLSTYGRLAQCAISRIQGSTDVERLMSNRAYALFSKVMHYAPFFKGIASVALDQTEALATIKLPEHQPARAESRVLHRCDSVLIDAFISVLGLLLNSSDVAPEEEVAIAAAIERVVLTRNCKTDSGSEWLVYAKFVSGNDIQPIGDVFVFDSRHELVAMMAGVQFASVNLSKLAKSLASANSTLSPPRRQQLEVGCLEHPKVLETINPEISMSTLVPTSPELPSGIGLEQIVSNYTGICAADVPQHVPLVDLGLDSLSSIDFIAELEMLFNVALQIEEIRAMTLADLAQRITSKHPGKHLSHFDGVPASNLSNPSIFPPSTLPSEETLEHGSSCTPSQAPTDPTTSCDQDAPPLINPLQALLETERKFEEAAHRRGYTAYHSVVAPLQDELTLAYILDAFCILGRDIRSSSPGNVICPISTVPKHQKLSSRLWEILQHHGLVVKHGEIMMRSRENIYVRSSQTIYEDFVSQFPQYLPEAKLMKLTGESLAHCLRGEQDALSLLFGSAASNSIMEDYYANSPMVSTLTDQLVTFVTTLLRNSTNGTESVRILEIGAGTGATTSRLAENLEAVGLTCEYTFTDISARMVAKAKEKLKTHPWISYALFDLEQEVPPAFRNRFDIVIGTNCVHATTSRVATCRRIHEALREGGVMVLSEGTCPLHWFDICFGILDGWWLSEHGTQHPLQPAITWMETLKDAGFLSTSFSCGPTREANTQQLLVGCKKQWPAPIRSFSPPTKSLDDTYRLETMVYKEIRGVQIHADVYIPRVVKSSPLPVALMVHGGGYMMLSRKSIRLAQTKYLISCGFLPVSIDYRLCPEVDITSGPITDVRDGYIWTRTELPQILRQYSVSVDGDRVVLIGWSTGGHLALTVGWTAKEVGVSPPTAILSFYAPLDFESGDLDRHSRRTLPLPKLSKEDILGPSNGIVRTNYIPEGMDDSSFFGLQPGDPRSDLLLSMSQDGTGLSLLLHDESPSQARIASISPLAQLRQGNFNTPTFIIHSQNDEVAPFISAERFVGEMNMRGGECKLLALEKISHLHDLHLRPGERGWEAGVEPGYKFLMEAVERESSQ